MLNESKGREMWEEAIRVLLVDDDPAYADLVQRMLSRIGKPRFAVQHAGSLADAARRIADEKFDVALLDMGLPESSGAETLARFRSTCSPEMPVIVVTGLANEATALETLESGALDYLVKDEMTPEVLSRSIRYALQRHQLMIQLATINGMLEQKNQRLAQLCSTAQEFVENVSHEFRTPLTVIREFTSIIRDGLDGGVTSRQVEHLEKIIHRADDLALMVDDLLDVSKLEAGLLGVWRRPYSVPEMIETVHGLVQSRADTKRIALDISLAENLPPVYCDEEKARRVIVNLAVNAIKFTPDGGTVKIWATASSNGEEVVIGVTDSGPGISDENLTVIFERFQQLEQNVRTRTKGFGLGLNIAKELVSLNLGQIRLVSAPGAGSTFSFTLPKDDPQIVFRRYLDRVLGTMEGACHDLSLLIAEVSPSESQSPMPVADEFLQRSVRASDLAFQYTDGKWLIAALCSQADSDRLIQRLEAEWSNFGRNCPKAKLPSLRIRRVETRSIAEERRDLEAAFIAQLGEPLNDFIAGPKVLVIDDDREVCHCLGVRLSAAGFTVLSACDGEEGLAAALAHQPDAVVLDIRMPKMDGLAVLRELRKHPCMRRMPIVMLSASTSDQQRALDAGANYFVSKPYKATDIL